MASKSWPASLDQTPPDEKAEYSEGPGGFHVSAEKALEGIEEELERLGATDIKVKEVGINVVAYYDFNGESNVIGSDNWDNLRDNARALEKYIDAKRAIGRYKVKTPKDEWENTSVPAVYEGPKSTGSASLFGGLGEVVGGLFSSSEPVEREDTEMNETDAALILGVDTNATTDEVEKAVRARAKEVHPDNGGSEEEFKSVMTAKEVLLGDGA